MHLKKWLFIALILISLSLLLPGCGSKPPGASGITQEATDMILKVSAKYGDTNPQIITARRYEDEVTKEYVYIIFLNGNFQNGGLTANHLEFSVLASGKKAWALRAYNDDNQSVWEIMKSDVDVSK